MEIKKILLTILILPFISLWAIMLLFSEIFSELELITAELMEKVAGAVGLKK